MKEGERRERNVMKRTQFRNGWRSFVSNRLCTNVVEVTNEKTSVYKERQKMIAALFQQLTIIFIDRI